MKLLPGEQLMDYTLHFKDLDFTFFSRFGFAEVRSTELEIEEIQNCHQQERLVVLKRLWKRKRFPQFSLMQC